ncbi:MAG: hypothetical protein JSW54_08005 [Fidelibacterota bacterium]|nr:MAG: hypothetical protein JSW54_08005 [Candidatus Neomarinimicrobiota bacterium]
MKHSPEPWFCDGLIIKAKGRGQPIGTTEPSSGSPDAGDYENAKRIAACVNACEQLPPEFLRRGVVRDLVALCERMLREMKTLPVSPSFVEEALDILSTARG